MVAALDNPAHHAIDVGSPFYSDVLSPGSALAGAPVLHKYDKTDFVDRFLGEVSTATATGEKPASLLRPLSTDVVSGVPDFDVDAIDFLKARFRKVYQPIHFRFYLAACELRCLVAGFPGPERKRVKKVELVVRRVAIRKNPVDPPGQANPPGAPAIVETDKEWAWTKIPDPTVFPGDPPSVTLELAPRITGNTHTWWPIPQGETAFEGEERYPMTRTPAANAGARAIYFAFLPLGSGAMYGPRKNVPTDPALAEDNPPYTPLPAPQPPASPDPGKPPEPLTKLQVKPAAPLVPAPSSFALKPVTMRGWKRNWMNVLGVFSSKTIDGPRSKFEPPPLTGNPDGGWGYVVRCVATIEVHPGCVIEQWGPPSQPVVIAPHYDPFGGRPTQIDIPSLGALKKMIGDLSAAQIAKRGGNNVAFRQPGEQPKLEGDPPEVNGTVTLNMICSFGLPLITICAYLMLNIALILMFPLKIAFSFLFALKFCIPIGVTKE